MWSRRRRAAISQSEIRKRCKLYGPIAEGYRAFQQTADGEYMDVPYHKGTPEHDAWLQGWHLAADKQREKDNERTG